MIVLVHGRFDYKNDAKSGIEVIASRLRELGLEVKTFDCDDKIDVDAWGYLGYSNGADTVQQEIEDKHPVETRLVVMLDPVWKSLWAQWWRKTFVIPSSTKLCVSYERTSQGFPRNSHVDRDQIIYTSLGHGEIPLDVTIQDQVIQLFQGAM